MAYSSGTSVVQSRPSPDHAYEESGIPALPGSGDSDRHLQGIPSFSLLDLSAADRKRRWLVLGFSPLCEGGAICLMLWALMSMPRPPELKVVRQEVLMFRLATPPPAVKHLPQLVKMPPLEPLHAAPILPSIRRAEMPKPEFAHLEAPKIRSQQIELPKPAPAPAIFASLSRPLLPVRRQMPVVHAAGFSPGSGAPGTIKRPLREVQTGGFGASDGIPGSAKDDGHTKVARLGSFDLPEGPGEGNGTGGTHGVRGTVASAGFGNAVGAPQGNALRGIVQQSGFGTAVGGRAGGSALGGVQQGGFGSVVTGNGAPRTPKAAAGLNFKPVVILSKPNPVYPAEARRLHLEGDIILSVNFEASGKLRVLNVIQGLGHGMDEAAVLAAENIRFEPAQRDGHPVDSQARVHIIFQLAY